MTLLPLHIDSSDWAIKIKGNVVYKENETADVWEYVCYIDKVMPTNLIGQQLFTYQAGMREAKKQGKRLPTIDELEEWMQENKNNKDLVSAGYRSTFGNFPNIADELNLWSAETVGADKARSCFLMSDGNFSSYNYGQQFGFSVRCLQDSLTLEERVERLESILLPKN